MFIDYISDLHLDSHFFGKKHSPENAYYETHFKGKQNSEVLLIAGDFGHNVNQVRRLIHILCHDYKYILFTTGNHEFWHTTGREKYPNYSAKIDDLVSSICSQQVIRLDGNVFDYKGCAIGGTMMWYDFSYAEKFHIHRGRFNEMGNIYMPDAERMGFGGRMDCEGWFNGEHNKAKKIINECDVFVSHVGPKVPNNLPKKFDNFATGFFYFDGTELLETNKIKHWVFGHTHDRIVETYAKKNGDSVNLLCNPVGYSGEHSNSVSVESFKV